MSLSVGRTFLSQKVANMETTLPFKIKIEGTELILNQVIRESPAPHPAVNESWPELISMFAPSFPILLSAALLKPDLHFHATAQYIYARA